MNNLVHLYSLQEEKEIKIEREKRIAWQKVEESPLNIDIHKYTFADTDMYMHTYMNKTNVMHRWNLFNQLNSRDFW